LSSTQDTKTANQTDHINDNKITTKLHGVSSVRKEGKEVMKKEIKNEIITKRQGSFLEGKTIN
jgi:hypothetical protein